MSKLGLSIRIDVSKIDKSRLYKGQKGTYLDLTTFVDLSQQDQYGNNGFISQSLSKDERASGEKTPILGNVKVFFDDASQQSQGRQQSNKPQQGGYVPQGDDIPF